MINGSLQQSVRQQRFPESAIEAKNKLVYIFLKISMRDSVESALQKALEVADHNMNLRKPLIHLFRRDDPGLVAMSFVQNPQRTQCIRTNFRIRRDALREFPNLFRSHPFHQTSCHETHPVFSPFHRENHRFLALGPAASLARLRPPTKASSISTSPSSQ